MISNKIKHLKAAEKLIDLQKKFHKYQKNDKIFSQVVKIFLQVMMVIKNF